MSSPSPEILTYLEGTTITLTPSPNSPLDIGRTKWEIVQKIHERVRFVTQEDVTSGLDPAYVAGKFLCRPTTPTDSNELSFLRIHKQIPIAGTEFQKAPIRAAQAVDSYEPTELTTRIRKLQANGYHLIPGTKKIVENRDVCCSSSNLLVLGFSAFLLLLT